MKKTSAKSPKMQVPAHGHGLLQVGNPGNKGGPGRPADRVRKMMLEDLESCVPRLKKMIDDKDTKDSDRIRAMEVLAKYGMPLQIEAGENPSAPFLTPAQRREAIKHRLGL